MLKRRESKTLNYLVELADKAANTKSTDELASIVMITLIALKAFPAVQVDEALDRAMDHLNLMIDEVKAEGITDQKGVATE